MLIPKEKLHAGFKKCQEHITMLLSDSRYLYDAGRYSSSIALSILANEEVGKMNMIRAHTVTKSDILMSEWSDMSKIGSHSFKLVSFYQNAFDDVIKMGKEHYDETVREEVKKGSKINFKGFDVIVKHVDVLKTRLQKFNEIKKACLYVDWKNDSWFSAPMYFTGYELNLIANFLLDFTGYEFFSEILSYKYPSPIFHQIPKQFNIMMNDSIWQQREEYAERIFHKEYQQFLDAINFLIDKFPEARKTR